MKRFIKIVRGLITAFLLILILINGIPIAQGLLLGEDEMPMIFGYGRAVVITGSMEPAIAPGDMVIFTAQDEYEVDDIVVFQADQFIVHRIVEITEHGYITQGDANNVEDGEILREQMIGRVVLIVPGIGYVTDFLKSPFGILVLVIGLLVLIEVPELFKKKSKRR